MKIILSLTILFLSTVPNLHAQEGEDKAALITLLNDFLEGASVNDIEMHDRFWAEELIYTSSNGERVNKQEIMQSLENDSDTTQTPDMPRYHAEDTEVRLYDDMAVVAFRLVSVSDTPEGRERLDFYNTGTFQKREGMWKAVAWQATRIPVEN